MISDDMKRQMVKALERFLDDPALEMAGFEFKVYDRAAFVVQYVVPSSSQELVGGSE